MSHIRIPPSQTPRYKENKRNRLYLRIERIFLKYPNISIFHILVNGGSGGVTGEREIGGRKRVI